jgi:radical SAM protein with 4Fe4S-binding SPASM domain
MVGDVLLDPRLKDRVEVLLAFRDSITTSVTTNLYALERHPDELIDLILSGFERLHISAYGVTEEECQELTGKGHFSRLVSNLERLIKRWEQSAKTCEITVGFRLAYPHSDEALAGFLREACGRVLPFGRTHQYANWGNSMSGSLPGDAEYVIGRENRDACALLAVALQVYWDGRVSACACCDYDACDQLYLGDLRSHTLEALFNSQNNQSLWRQHVEGVLPEICRHCTFHFPLRKVNPKHPIVTKIADFIGG